MTTPEISTDTAALRAAAARLHAHADAVDAAAAVFESRRGPAASEIAAFADGHQPASVYRDRAAEAGTASGRMRDAVTALAARIRSEADALTAHAEKVDITESDNTQAMHRL